MNQMVRVINKIAHYYRGRNATISKVAFAVKNVLLRLFYTPVAYEDRGSGYGSIIEPGENPMDRYYDCIRWDNGAHTPVPLLPYAIWKGLPVEDHSVCDGSCSVCDRGRDIKY